MVNSRDGFFRLNKKFGNLKMRGSYTNLMCWDLLRAIIRTLVYLPNKVKMLLEKVPWQLAGNNEKGKVALDFLLV